ncbi:hypothetical protein CORC01_05039 [Colletotrichum orchidophilum]|uniref:Uncharacterized protein n=1 Tax=Colletotrichum orchidophilum TaxID=1209926 RepID=A0A1G4BE53_9PEZI|nr:uncharacterized protein CORC01_05039 [Colletotrichum orchidophilum]OHE99681.1 hypothetical protein CORC01_05039 [Colletotrichum orchidophilum]
MGDSPSIKHTILRDGTPKEVAKYLKQLRTNAADPASITSSLHDAVVQGSISHGVFSIWIPISDDAKSIIAALSQSESMHERHVAVRAFLKAMRSPKTMTSLWDAAGGAQGVAAIMSNLSVDEIKMLCNGLAKTASLSQGRSQRHAKLTELVDILGAGIPIPKENPDARPLLPYYRRILPACTTERVVEHEATSPKWTARQRSILLRTHPALYEAKFLESIFSCEESQTTKFDVDTWTRLFNNNFGFGKKVLLKFLDAGDKLPVKPGVFISQIAVPIARRLRRRRTAAEHHLPHDVLELLAQLIGRHSALHSTLDESLNGIIFHAIKFWEHTRSTRPRVEQHLIELLSLAPETRFQSADSIVPLLRAVKPAVSYRLFRLMLQHLRAYRIDIDDDTGSDGSSFKKLRGLWPASFFVTMLGSNDRLASLRLFQRLMAVFPDGSFLKRSSERVGSIFDHEQDPDSIRGDGVALEAFLLRTSSAPRSLDPGHDSKIDADLQERRRKASSSRDWESRAFWARSALNLSIAAGSLEVYAENLLWVRRFNKDIHAVKEIYSHRALKTAEGIDLLSGIAVASYARNPDFDAAKVIRSANKILMQLLETASMALGEPSFQGHDWHAVTTVPAAVVERRFRMVNEFQDARKLTDAEVYDVVWQPTVDFLVEAETFMLHADHHKLYPSGFVGLLTNTDCFNKCEVRTHVVRFVDELAKARNVLWEKHRPQRFPSVLTLEEPWPKGLSVQSLLPHDFYDLKDIDNMPYIRQRIEKVVFGAPEVLLQEPPKDKESRAAIGRFVDYYDFALKAYVNGQKANSQREERARKAWHHAVDQLSGTRMTKAEALRFWDNRFKSNRIRLPTDVKAEFPRRDEPAIPPVDDPETPTEWNPDPNHLEFEELHRKEIPIKILDEMTTGSFIFSGDSGIWGMSSLVGSAWVPFRNATNFWDAKQFTGPLSGKGVDAFSASFLLTLNTMHGCGNSILKQPFPSTADVRYPALYLDQEFIETIDENFFYKNEAQALHILRSGPPALLAQVVQSILQNVDGNEESESRKRAPNRLAMKLIKVLASSDQPSLAFPFIRDVILSRPSDSAWHRELLTKGFFNTIPPMEAKKLLGMISLGIQEKLKEQQVRYRKAKEEDGEPVAQSAPAVKVTTVKMLAKLLSNAPFLDITSAIDILVGVLTKAQHIDIRVAIIQTMFDTLDFETASADVKDRILVLLEDLAVPLAASLTERRPMTETDWDKAESDGELPEVADATDQSAAPIRSLFYRLDQRLCNDPVSKAKLASITERLKLQSAENNRRWLELFLRKNGFSLPPGESLPLTPVDPDMLKIFPRSPEYFSRPTFEMLTQYVLANLRPSPGVVAINKKVRSNSILAMSNAGKHWLLLYGADEQKIALGGWTDCLARMHQTDMSKQVVNPNDRITVEMLQQFAKDFADGLISHGIPSHVEALFKTMSSTMVKEKNPEALQRWQSTTQPVLRSIITRIEELRTASWQRDLKRKPKALPDTFHLKIEMLAFPPGAADLDASFAKEISALIDELATGHTPYHNNWAHLRHWLARGSPAWMPRLAYLAVLMGDLSNVNVENPTLADYMRIEMAKDFMMRAHNPHDKNVVAKLKEMLRTWAECPVENFRSDAKDGLASFHNGWGSDWFTEDGGLEWADEDSDEESS